MSTMIYTTIGLLLALGLLFSLLGVKTLIWKRKSRQEIPDPQKINQETCKARGTTLLFAAGAVSFLAAAFVSWRYWPFVLRLFLQDFDGDFAQLERLQNTVLMPAHQEPALPGEWPQWRGFYRDGRSTSTGFLSDWPKDGPPVVWRKPIKGGYSSIAVSQGRLFTMERDGGQERVLCLDASTGKELWSYFYEVDYQGIQYASGPRATPTVHDGRVYTLGAAGTFLCLDADPSGPKGKVIWEHRDLLNQFSARKPAWGLACSPLVEGDLVIVQPGGSQGSVAAFNRRTGELRWKALADASGYSSPIAVTAAGIRQIICFTGERMAGLRPNNGDKLWDFKWTTGYECNVATPIVAGNYVFLSSNYGAGCALLELTEQGGVVSCAPVWIKRGKLMRNHFSTCVLHDGHLYGFDGDGGAVGSFKCIDLKSASEKWSASPRDLAKATVLFADGHLLIMTEDGNLAWVEAQPDAFKVKGKFRLFSRSECWAAPALAAGRAYIRDNQEIVCVDLRK